ncbi:NAD(P)H-dependent oxidoreductase [Paenibacillus sp. MWE-103]|uniref:NAD(P)H-dependent oxidoreductase n=1 Tax=Paenibacillus artemisiicola TaxID=1172618 RepID=A0ABS3WF66_9BACL|nr:NAD(P)H-dependent oxidoreductase [Paenibacillus artemisiicola]MBO7746755.1 NAD(P)H-dependent oxidoreductase [Paenibacillus artemisiicola]
MKKSLVLVAHPNLENSNVNKRWLVEIQQYPAFITINDLYANYPNFQIDVVKEQLLVEQHDRIIFQFPFYWYSSPPLLKKWLDDVLTYGWAFTSKGSKLKGKELALAISIGGSESDYRHGEGEGYSINELISPFHETSNLIETNFLVPFTLLALIKRVIKSYVRVLESMQIITSALEPFVNG